MKFFKKHQHGKGGIMASRVIYAAFFFVFVAGVVYGAETVEVTGSPSIAVSETNTIGIGTEGYGSPVQSNSISSGEIHSSRSGYFHPFLSLGGYYTDNLFNTDNNEKSDTVAVITPGFWLARPASRQKLVDINTLNTAPGGLSLSRFRNEDERRLQTYALYRADIYEHDKYSDENHTDQRGEGMIRLALRGGLSFELADVYEKNTDPYGTGGTSDRELDKYTSNLFTGVLSYQLTPKVLLRADYGHYYLDYRADRNEYRNREDDSLSAYIYYIKTPKTSFFVQSEYIWVDYDEEINSDSDTANYYVGIEMKTSAKTRSLLKIGYSNKDYDASGVNDRDELVYEGRIDYFLTPKTSLYLRTNRRVLETDTEGFNDVLSYRTQLGYRQRITAKLRFEAAVHHINDDYSGKVTIGDEIKGRDDDRYGFVAAIGLSPRRWLNLSLGYEYEERDSNFDSEDYTSNTFFFRATAAL
jgi:hypothetical protein